MFLEYKGSSNKLVLTYWHTNGTRLACTAACASTVHVLHAVHVLLVLLLVQVLYMYCLYCYSCKYCTKKYCTACSTCTLYTWKYCTACSACAARASLVLNSTVLHIVHILLMQVLYKTVLYCMEVLYCM